MPVAVLAWLTWRIVEQDRALAQQTLRDRLEHSADLIVAELDRDIVLLEDQLVQSPATLLTDSSDAVIVSFEGNRFDVTPPGRLAFYPTTPAPPLSSYSQFVAAEDFEFRTRDYAAAINALREIARSSSATTRAEALVRLARVLRKNGQREQALAVYDSLAQIPTVSIGGVPTELLARDARCAVLAEQGRTEALARDAAALAVDLRSGRWRIDRATWLMYTERVQEWTGDAVAKRGTVLANGVDRLWKEWSDTQSPEEGARRRLTWRVGDSTVLVFATTLRKRLTALVVEPRFLESRQKRFWQEQQVKVALTDADGRTVIGDGAQRGTLSALRSIDESRLPWTVRVTSSSPDVELVQLEGRRRLLFTGLLVTVLVTMLGGYLTVRATARELAVARLQSDFVSAVSHEFRTPLTSLRHLTELLASGSVDREDRRREYFAMLSRETERLHRMVDGLLQFGQMEAGKRQYEFEATDPVELVEHVVADFREDFASEGRRVELDVTDTHATIRVDREALSRAIRNLLENGVKYSAAPAPVEVSVTKHEGRVVIRVRDHGAGIPSEEQSSIFDQFVRGSSARAMNVKGTGVGLAMVRHIVRAHGGEIALTSEPGRGSTFSILLPAETRHGAPDVVIESART